MKSLIKKFRRFESWESQYKYLIELGHSMPRLGQADRLEENKVRGCQSQVWLICTQESGSLMLKADSDAQIVRGLLALVLMLFNGCDFKDVPAVDVSAFFEELGLGQHLSPSRANGVNSMVEKIQSYAKEVIA